MKKLMLVLCVMCFVGFTGAIGYAGCYSPTGDFPPECPFQSPIDGMMVPVIGGTLQFATTIIMPPAGNVTRMPCDNIVCNCEILTFEATLDLHITGTGDLAGYVRDLPLQVNCEVHIGPRNPGDPVQTIETEMVALNLLGGPLVGDPDFDFLDIVAGGSNGLPSPGSTTPKKLPDGDFAVDSFFDITYQITFSGAPGGPLDGLMGDNIETIRLTTPPEVQVHFLLADYEDWQNAFNSGEIAPMSQAEGEIYLEKLAIDFQDGDPYPFGPSSFVEPNLYVLPDEDYADEPGLVMEWGDKGEGDGDYTSAWRYIYAEDPDLTNTTIAVTVDPPCGMNVISLGMQDINGNIRAWYWNVAPVGAPLPLPPGTIPCSTPPTGPTTAVSVNTAQTGVTAATPAAFGYSSTPGFDITQVISFSFDENNAFVGTAQAPAPGSGQMVSWNYWYNLLVSPNIGGGGDTVDSKWFVKYSQPPEEIEDGVINGWDEVSNYNHQPDPIMADDWECTDERPITDIHWWGSFIGWTQPDPPQLPDAFHIGIWTDVPDPNKADPADWSHPGTLVWENYCESFVWNFAGYDLDPRVGEAGHQEDEACFQFAQFLSQDEWFYQEPNEMTGKNVYWISIAAVYNNPDTIPYPWGWKTRPHFFNDDAVRILATADGTWPPAIGSTLAMANCDPVEFPDGISWDLSFELTTNDPAYKDDPIPGDISGPVAGEPDGKVDLIDLSVIAANWLEIALL